MECLSRVLLYGMGGIVFTVLYLVVAVILGELFAYILNGGR